MNRVFVGVDPRQPLGYNVLQWSIHRHAKKRVSVEPLMLPKLPITRRGLTEFTYSRYLVPYLCGYEGSAVFMDADIVVTGDTSLDAKILTEMAAHSLAEELFPAVAIFRVRWVGIFFFQARIVGSLLLEACINASRRGVEESLCPAFASCH